MLNLSSRLPHPCQQQSLSSGPEPSAIIIFSQRQITALISSNLLPALQALYNVSIPAFK